MTKRTALCLVDTDEQAHATVAQLRAAGFSQDDISVLFPDKGSTKEFAHQKETKLPEGATVGASTGGVFGGTVGLLAGLGALAIPGLGPFIAAGPLMAALSGGAIGAGLGGLTGALVGLGIPEYEAKRYEGKVKEGGILISVHSEDSQETQRAKDIFKAAGAHDISSTGEAHADDHALGHPEERRGAVPVDGSQNPRGSQSALTGAPHEAFEVDEPGSGQRTRQERRAEQEKP